VLVTATAPREVLLEVGRSIWQWQWHRICGRAGLAWQGVWHEPWRRLLRGSHGGLAAQQLGSLAVVVAGQCWTQQRKQQAGLAQDAKCIVCGREDTWAHRCYSCRGLQQWPGLQDFEALRAEVMQERTYTVSEWQQGLHLQGIDRPLMLEPCAGAEAVESQGIEEKLSGCIYTDGSGLQPQHLELTRCGWAFVSCSADGKVKRAEWGALPGDLQSVHRAEVYAILRVLHALLSQVCKHGISSEICIVSDCKAAVGMFESGPLKATSTKCMHAAHWRRVFHVLELVRSKGQRVCIRWVPAHQTAEDVQQGRISHDDWVGNMHADEAAKKGAAMHRVPDTQCQLYLRSLERNVSIIKFLAGVHGFAVSSQIWNPAIVVQKPVKPPPVPQLIVIRHELRSEGQVTFCSRCRRHGSNLAQVKAFVAAPCVSFLPGAGEVSKVHGSHQLFVSAGVVWCLRCGRYAAKSAKGLASPCSQPAKWGLYCIARFKKGLHPDAAFKHVFLGRPEPA